MVWQRGGRNVAKLSVQQKRKPHQSGGASFFFFPPPLLPLFYSNFHEFIHVQGFIWYVKSINAHKMTGSPCNRDANPPTSNQARINSINAFLNWSVYSSHSVVRYKSKLPTFNLPVFWIRSGVSSVKASDLLIDKRRACGQGLSHGNGFVVVSLRWMNRWPDRKLGK